MTVPRASLRFSRTTSTIVYMAVKSGAFEMFSVFIQFSCFVRVRRGILIIRVQLLKFI